jgi:hypothetical protein
MLLELASMKRLADALSWTLIVCIVCFIGVSIAVVLHRKTVRSLYSVEPTITNTTAITTGDGRTYYAPANLVRRRAVLNATFVVLLGLSLAVAFALSLVKSIAKRRRLRSIQALRPVDARSISWIVPMSVTWQVIRSPRGWIPFLLMLVIGYLVLDWAFRTDPRPNIAPDSLAMRCTGIMALAYPVMAIMLLLQTNRITLDDEGITFQVAGKTGRRSTSTYRSIAACWIEPSRWVPSLPCLTFKAPGRVRAEKTSRFEMPADADVGAVIQFLATKGVICVDRR